MSFTPQVSQRHDALAQIMRTLQGQILTTAEIKAHVNQVLGPEDAQWVQPSDHCINHTCDGDCDCAGTVNAVFEQIERGRYLVR
jgi:hypothetical protein